MQLRLSRGRRAVGKTEHRTEKYPARGIMIIAIITKIITIIEVKYLWGLTFRIFIAVLWKKKIKTKLKKENNLREKTRR